MLTIAIVSLATSGSLGGVYGLVVEWVVEAILFAVPMFTADQFLRAPADSEVREGLAESLVERIFKVSFKGSFIWHMMVFSTLLVGSVLFLDWPIALGLLLYSVGAYYSELNQAIYGSRSISYIRSTQRKAGSKAITAEDAELEPPAVEDFIALPGLTAIDF